MLKMSDDSLNESLIERLKQSSTKPNDNVEAIRAAAARLHSRTASQDKNIRERTLERIWRKNNGALPLIITLIESVRDHLTSCSLAGILHECVSPKSGKHRSPAVSQLVAMNGTQLLVKLVMQMQVKDAHMADILLYEVIWILAQLAQRDPKFSIKTRLLGAVKTFHNLLRVHYNNTKVLFPILLVIKALSKNSSTTTVLVKDGIVSTLEKVIIGIGLSPNPKLRLALNVMHHLSKSRLCCTRILKTGVHLLLLQIFERWERYDGKMRLRICNHTLVTLKHICSTKLGKKAIRTSNGLQVLHKFCTACPDDKCYDSLLSRVCSIINLCLEKQQLPIENYFGPASFNLPLVISSSNDLDHAEQKTSYSRETSPASDDDSDEEFADDNIDDEDDEGEDNKKKDSEEKGHFASTSYPVQRDLEDLKEYTNNFREVFQSEVQINSNTRAQKITPRTKSFQGMYSRHDSLDSEDRDVRKPVINSSRDSLYKHKDMKTLSSQTMHMVSPHSDNALHNKGMENLQSVCSNHADVLMTINSLEGSRPSSPLMSAKDILNSRAVSEPVVKRFPYNNEYIVKGLTILANIPSHAGFHYAYSVIAARVNSVLPFSKVAYPDMVGGDGSGKLEPLNVKDRRVCRAKLLGCVERGINPNSILNKVVFDLDSMTTSQPTSKSCDVTERNLYNLDERHIGQKEPTKYHLTFESRFESGNLRKAYQIGPREYDLILMPDVNSNRHHQWFYFEVSNMEADVLYVFNIINCEKQNSQFNYGMKPILYSVCESVLGRPGWVRIGTDICYYRNNYQNRSGRSKSSYLTTTFSITFPHTNDVCYIAYHYPYTYSQLLAQIWKWSLTVDSSLVYFRAESLCLSLNNNEAPLLTITAPDSDSNPLLLRDVVFLTARVHPSESNSSWVMHGTLNYLLSDTPVAVRLRNKFLFKIVPMLNIEGVINGCHRCGLTDEDLNRRWSRPNLYLHPVIYHTKGLIQYCTYAMKKTPYLFCDYHGHSRRKNVFLYGCCNTGSWNAADRALGDDPVDYLMLPHLMQHFSQAFALTSCNFRVERARESTARVTVWREFGIKRSYTMESSFCGCDQGFYQGHHVDTLHLKEIGANFCEALACLKDETSWRTDLMISPEEVAGYECFQGVRQQDSGDDSDSVGNSDSSGYDEEYHCLQD